MTMFNSRNQWNFNCCMCLQLLLLRKSALMENLIKEDVIMQYALEP